MAEWWSYRLGSFLLFSETTYQRLISSFNDQMWPLQWVATALVAMLLLVLLLGSMRPLSQPLSSSPAGAHLPPEANAYRWLNRCLWLGLVAAWAWSALAFLIQRFMAINWAAEYLAWLMGLQALMLCAVALFSNRLALARPAKAGVSLDFCGLGTVALGLLAYPLVSASWGQDWSQAHSFALLPEPTAITTLGLLLLAPRAPWWLWPLPLLVCIWSGLWLWALAAPAAWLAPAAAATALLRLGMLRMGLFRRGC